MAIVNKQGVVIGISNPVSISQLEYRLLELEEILIIIRAPVNKKLPAYPYDRKAKGSMTLGQFKKTRLSYILDLYEVAIIDGNYVEPHPAVLLSTLRGSYEH